MNAFVACFLISVTALLSFWPGLGGKFVFDDVEAIINNADILMTSPWYQTFHNDFWGKLLVSNTSHKSYRPLTVLTFRLNSMWNTGTTSETLNPFSFHVVNLGLHVVSCLVILRAYNFIVCNGQCLTRRTTVSNVSLYAALLFAAHPVHSENVAGIVGRADILCAIFFFLAFLTYAQSCHHGKEVPLRTQSFPMIVFAILTAVSMLFKEQGVTVLGICVVYDLLNTLKSKHRTKCSSFFCRCALLFGIGCVALSFRWWIMGSSPPIFQRMDNPSSFLETRLQRTLNYNYIYSINAWILIHPLWLCYDWSMGCIPMIDNAATDWRVVLIVAFWTTVYLLVVAIRDFQSRSRAIAISFSLIVIPFLPAANFLFRVGFVVAERILFIPSSGFCLLVAVGYERILESFSKYNWVFKFLGAACLIVFVLRSRQRSYDWLSEESLFESGLNVCPLNAKVHYNIAKKAADAGHYETAVERYTEALRLFPQYDQAMNNLANILKDQGRLSEAEDLLVSAVRIRPDFAAAWMNLGIVQSSLRKYIDAESSYRTALSHRKQYPDCYYNLGNLYLEKQQYDDALRAWLNATSLKPTHSVSWNNMIIMLDNQGDFDRARSMAEEAIRCLPNESSIHFNMANVLGKLGEFERSEDHFLTAIHLSPENSSYFTNLGVLYHRWKRYGKAEEAYRRALKLNPSMQSAKDNLFQLLETRAKLGRTSSSSSV